MGARESSKNLRTSCYCICHLVPLPGLVGHGSQEKHTIVLGGVDNDRMNDESGECLCITFITQLPGRCMLVGYIVEHPPEYRSPTTVNAAGTCSKTISNGLPR